MLTGDKLETAESIGHSCNLLADSNIQKIPDSLDSSLLRELIKEKSVEQPLLNPNLIIETKALAKVL